MGFSLPMFLPSRSFARRLVGAFVFVFAAFVAAQAWAQTPVETYTNQAVPPSTTEGVLPEGIEWNKPLKAGDLVLPRLPKEKSSAKAKKTERPNLPVGELKAPQIQKPAQPPLMSSSKTSSASVMLMQGMKSALQKSGQNPNIPVTTSSPGELSVSDSIGTATLAPPQLNAYSGTEPLEQGEGSDPFVKYEPGRAPQNLASGKTTDQQAPLTDDSSDDSSLPSTEKSLTPSIDAGLSDLDIPKATDLQQPPVPLDQVAGKHASESSKVEKKSDGLFSSIFGPPVKDTDEEKTEAAASAPSGAGAEKLPSASCETKVISWTKECSDAGYPSGFGGKITGETRTECPSGDVKDVWLSNTCAASETAKANEPTPLMSSSSARVDANCGTANGLATDGKPAADLCAAGTAGVVSGGGPWRWSCSGMNGGMTVSCAAPVAKASIKAPEKAASAVTATPSPEDGKCGVSDEVGFDSAPSENLCAKGIASRVNGGGPWTWACSGTNGGQAAACKAPKKVDGACGTAGGASVDTMPERDLCVTGYASAVTGEGPWSWTCSGLYGGEAATCSVSPKVNAVCGTASLTGHHEAPKDGLCNVGDSSAVEGEGPWTWTCSGSQGGASVSCKAATKVDGVCGAANGQSFDKTPDDDLCTQGHASRVTGLGPWNWNCSGLEGGQTVSCTAALGHKASEASKAVACGTAAETPAFQTPTQSLCAGGNASAVSGDGPWTWSCSDDKGHNVACMALKATEGSCGTAANVPNATEPVDNLCATGAAGSVTSDKAKTHWTWDCRGTLGASTVSCSSPVMQKSDHEEAKCGAADGRGVATAPKADLCAVGKAVSVRGKGPWTWTCAAKSGRKVNCEAPKLVDAICGTANGSIQKSLPLSGLCAAGAPTGVDGTGPWLWSCVGAGGGASVSCSAASQAQAKVEGACGAAANAVMTRAPEANLCDSGVPSSVNGEGPWTWTCSGVNGGIASTCTTTKVLPKAPPPPGPPVNARCGPANGVAGVDQPDEGLCTSGTATDVSGNGPWNWNCIGINGGMTVSCTAPMMPPAPIVGECGSANGVTTLTTPRSGLCSAGISSAVSGKGPWTWSCSGTNGGGAVSCVAPLAGKGTHSIPSTASPSSSYDDSEAPAPAAAPVGLVTPRLPSGTLPPLETGTLPQLTPSKPLNVPPEALMLPQKNFPAADLPPELEPELSSGNTSMSPPVRDNVKPPPALKPPSVTEDGKILPSGRLALDSELSSLSFDRGSDAIDSTAAKTLDKLAEKLKNYGTSRITLNAYAGTTGDISPREARRLSLSRALGVRDYLTNKGISSGRIDVRALGANVPSGDMDRVDIKAN